MPVRIFDQSETTAEWVQSREKIQSSLSLHVRWQSLPMGMAKLMPGRRLLYVRVVTGAELEKQSVMERDHVAIAPQSILRSTNSPA